MRFSILALLFASSLSMAQHTPQKFSGYGGNCNNCRLRPRLADTPNTPLLPDPSLTCDSCNYESDLQYEGCESTKNSNGLFSCTVAGGNMPLNPCFVNRDNVVKYADKLVSPPEL